MAMKSPLVFAYRKREFNLIIPTEAAEENKENSVPK